MKLNYNLSRIASLVVLITLLQPATAQNTCPIIPLPVESRQVVGAFTFDGQTTIVTNHKSLQSVAKYLQEEIVKRKGVTLKLGAATKLQQIKLQIQTAKPPPDEDYALKMSPRQVLITSQTVAGVFNGVVSFLQLAAANPGNSVACWQINDWPRYAWRGFMLDESRHFFGKEKVKQILDQMAFYKLNRFHWHLTDEPGWRIEIKQYPRLAQVGGKGSYTDSTAPVSYYTQQEIKEIVAYAANRQIVVIPEIDMPGHATAANKAYPEHSGGGSDKHPEFTFNPGKEATYQYLTNILKEVNALFPSQMIHIGGDEVSFGNDKWLSNADVKALMAREGLMDVKAVEFYFIKRMADSLAKMNNKCLAWDEVAQADLNPKQTIVFWWRQEHPKQLSTSLAKGYPVVLCPRLPFYFDFVQDSTHKSGRKWGNKKQYNSLEEVYDFSVAGVEGYSDTSRSILGIQANLWTETIRTEQRLDFMTFPRLCAVAEAAWTPAAQKNFPNFNQRLQKQLPLLRQAGIQYYDYLQPQQSPEPVR